ncbi:hypothetical protein B0H17DRAFT_1083253 [Mycena rosella]|uniref:FAD linked oxidase N-terminal domain-containing protein n=1 Tax=Mycena rosella TaxID=1033263 RepID=A0AAD7D0N6_MYCRO|nr:hypothetical protein B0H17DRAFT_1083253 [Mycena rosella]
MSPTMIPILRALIYIASFVTVVSAQESSTGTASNLTTAAVRSASSSACVAIGRALGSLIVESSGSEYTATAQGPWSLFNSLDQPTCIVYPRTASHVQVAMKSIFHFGSHYAVQAGAHSAVVGGQQWRLISFAHMNSVSYSPVTGTVTVLPGVHWGDAMAAIEPYASDIGMGLLLGGGISFISPLDGFVLVTGELVTATATNTYSDLFRALKGGANRFGIVTRYELYPAHTGTKDEKSWFGGIVVYPGLSSVAVSNASARYIREVTDPKAGLIVILNTINLTAVDANTVYLFYNGAELPQSIFGDFLSIPSTSQSLSPLSYFDITNLISGNDRGNGKQFGAASWVGDENTFLSGYNHLINFTRTFEAELLASYMIISPVPRSQWTAAPRTRGGNSIGDPGVSYAAINFDLIYPAGVTTVPKDANTGFELLLSQTPPSPGVPLYINECHGSQNVYKTYPAFAALEKTYAKYDPSRFNIEHTAGPIGL